MSLINDALKRAKEAQQQNTPQAAGPALKPVDAATAKSASNSKSLLYIMVACVVFGNALLFFAIKDRGAKTTVTPPSQNATATAPATAPVANPAPALTPVVAATPTITTAPVPAVIASPVPVAAPVVEATNAAAALPVVAIAPEPPKPAPLKLQGIIYNPAKPSAMVGGKFLLIGESVQGFRVTAIDQQTVTLIGNGQTNVLSLP